MVITVCNNKGGVLKTTMLANLSKYFAVDKHKKIILIDLDGQGNMSVIFGIDPLKLKYSIANLLNGEDISIKKCIFRVNEWVSILGCNLDILNVKNAQKIKNFKKILNELKKTYDMILIDTPPSVDQFILSVIKESDLVLIPSTMEKLGLEATRVILEALPGIHFENEKWKAIVVPTKFNERSTLHAQVLGSLKRDYSESKNIIMWDHWISQSIINDNTVMYARAPITYTSTKNKNVDEYKALANAII